MDMATAAAGNLASKPRIEEEEYFCVLGEMASHVKIAIGRDSQAIRRCA